MAKDSSRAAVYANECAEVRRMARTTMQYELALEQIALRLETVQQFGDVVDTLAPIVGVMRVVRSQIRGILPSISYELSTIIENLDNVIIEVGETPSCSLDINAPTEMAQRILSEAGTVAEERMRERFPELPTPIAPARSPLTEQSGQ
jgi:division protein CdvB (Snf7/Vps24/ESCRT-III family)